VIPVRLPAPALDQLSFLFGPLSDSQVRCVLCLDGRLDAQRLQRALRLSLDAEPVVGCRFVQQRGRFAWERRADLNCLPLCEIVVCPDPQLRERELQRFLVAPMDISAGPAVAACLLRADTDTLVVKLHHFAADGLGMLRFLMVLATIYRELSVHPSYQPSPNLAGRGQEQVLRRAGFLSLLAALGSTRLPARTASWGPIATEGERSGRAFALRRVGSEQVRALRAWGHAQHVSVNDLLLAALYQALYATIGATPGHPLIVGVPIDLRRYLAPSQILPVCNLSNSADVAITYRPGATFDDTLQRVHAAMRVLKSSGQGLTLAVLAELLAVPGFTLARTALEQIVRRLAPTGSAKPFLSNIGIIDERLVDFGELTVVDAYGLGPVSFPPGLLITVSTFREVMTVAIGFCDTATDRRLVERLLDQLVGRLPTSLAFPPALALVSNTNLKRPIPDA
jgi:NRPS condensation-like uncharacterized protein